MLEIAILRINYGLFSNINDFRIQDDFSKIARTAENHQRNSFLDLFELYLTSFHDFFDILHTNTNAKYQCLKCDGD